MNPEAGGKCRRYEKAAPGFPSQSKFCPFCATDQSVFPALNSCPPIPDNPARSDRL